MMSTPFWPSTWLMRVWAATTPSRPRGLASEVVPDIGTPYQEIGGVPCRIVRDCERRDYPTAPEPPQRDPLPARPCEKGIGTPRRLRHVRAAVRREELRRVLPECGRRVEDRRSPAVHLPGEREQRRALAAREPMLRHHAARGERRVRDGLVHVAHRPGGHTPAAETLSPRLHRKSGA